MRKNPLCKKTSSNYISTKEINYLEHRFFAYGPRDVSGEEPPFSIINSYIMLCCYVKRSDSDDMLRFHKGFDLSHERFFAPKARIFAWVLKRVI